MTSSSSPLSSLLPREEEGSKSSPLSSLLPCEEEGSKSSPLSSLLPCEEEGSKSSPLSSLLPCEEEGSKLVSSNKTEKFCVLPKRTNFQASKPIQPEIFVVDTVLLQFKIFSDKNPVPLDTVSSTEDP